MAAGLEGDTGGEDEGSNEDTSATAKRVGNGGTEEGT